MCFDFTKLSQEEQLSLSRKLTESLGPPQGLPTYKLPDVPMGSPALDSVRELAESAKRQSDDVQSLAERACKSANAVSDIVEQLRAQVEALQAEAKASKKRNTLNTVLSVIAIIVSLVACFFTYIGVADKLAVFFNQIIGVAFGV